MQNLNPQTQAHINVNYLAERDYSNSSCHGGFHTRGKVSSHNEVFFFSLLFHHLLSIDSFAFSFICRFCEIDGKYETLSCFIFLMMPLIPHSRCHIFLLSRSITSKSSRFFAAHLCFK